MIKSHAVWSNTVQDNLTLLASTYSVTATRVVISLLIADASNTLIGQLHHMS